MTSPRQAGFGFPAEWAPHEAVLLAWPSDPALWDARLAPAQDEFVALAEAIADPDPETGDLLGEALWVLVGDDAARRQAESRLSGLSPRLIDIPYGDIWMRDIAPLVVRDAAGARGSVVFRFNGWGGKYLMPPDDQVAGRGYTIPLPSPTSHQSRHRLSEPRSGRTPRLSYRAAPAVYHPWYG